MGILQFRDGGMDVRPLVNGPYDDYKITGSDHSLGTQRWIMSTGNKRGERAPPADWENYSSASPHPGI